MINILFVYERKIATTEGLYEVFSSDAAKKQGINSIFVNAWRINGKALKWADIIVFARNLDLLSQWVLKKAKKNDIFVIQFFDDDVLSLPRKAVNRVQFLPWRKRAVKKGFEKTDLILSSNMLLAKKYAKMIPSHRFASFDTVVDPASLIPLHEREEHYGNDKVKIVFAAGANHEDMFNKYILPQMHDLILRFNNKISFTFFGVHPDLSEYEDEIEVNYIGAMSLGQYRKTIQSGYYDIGLAPLESNEFTQYKYFNKYIEYTIAGMPGIYSNVLPYTLAVTDKGNGYLTENTAEDWFETLCTAIENSALRESCYRHAYEDIITNMHADSIFKKLKTDIPELERGHRNKPLIFVGELKIGFIFYRFIEAVYLVFEYIRMTGISGAVKKIISYLGDRKIAMTERLGE